MPLVKLFSYNFVLGSKMSCRSRGFNYFDCNCKCPNWT